jgi:hypothetical protein
MTQANLETAFRFDPPRRKGMALHITALLLIFALLAVLLTVAVSEPAGLLVVILLILALLFSLLLPLLFYRLYSLVKSGYWVSRDGLRLRWGLRQVDLPHAAIVDVARVGELENFIAPPRWTWPGALVGIVHEAELGDVEFMAADKQDLVLLGTKERVYAISPQSSRDFVATVKREALRGSLRALRPRSVSASFVLVEAWAEKRTRTLLIGGAILSLGLLLLAGLLAPGLPSVSLGFSADGLPLTPVAGVQLFLLPALNLFFYMGNLMLGLLFYREPNGVNFSYLLWGCSLFASVLFLGAILFSL